MSGALRGSMPASAPPAPRQRGAHLNAFGDSSVVAKGHSSLSLAGQAGERSTQGKRPRARRGDAPAPKSTFLPVCRCSSPSVSSLLGKMIPLAVDKAAWHAISACFLNSGSVESSVAHGADTRAMPQQERGDEVWRLARRAYPGPAAPVEAESRLRRRRRRHATPPPRACVRARARAQPPLPATETPLSAAARRLMRPSAAAGGQAATSAQAVQYLNSVVRAAACAPRRPRPDAQPAPAVRSRPFRAAVRGGAEVGHPRALPGAAGGAHTAATARRLQRR